MHGDGESVPLGGMDPAALATMVKALRGAASFGSAAPHLLRPLVGAADAALEASPFAGRGRAVRAAVHLRGSDAYRAAAVHEVGGPSTGDRRFESTSAWRWVSNRGAPIAVDVLLGHVHLAADPETSLATGRSALGASFGGAASREDLMSRGTTHVLVHPLRDVAGELAGIVSIEAMCRSALGRPFPWDVALDDVALLVDVAGPILAALPVEAAPSDEADAADPLLPVCGSTMQPLAALLRLFAAQDETVLLLGATGVGKSRMARYVHARSGRAGGPFETVDLLSVPPDMQTAELFGWKRGAFTGAVASHDGYVARAAGGTLFIDEVDKLSLAAQASLLQLLETRRFRVLGDDRGEQGANVRFVVGTNADLAEAVRRGAFREDLYYRINVLAVRLPGLDDRKDELVPWAEHMLRRRADEGAGSVDVLLAGDAASALLERSWPGNLRQLDNVVRRAFVLALADESGPGPRRVTRSHVAASLAAEAGPSSAEAGGGGGIIDALREVAALYVRDARRRHDAGCPVDLDEVLVLRALVLAEALRAADGDAAVAFGWLGRSGLVRSRNHHKTLERERDRLRSFATELGEPLPGELLARLVPR